MITNKIFNEGEDLAPLLKPDNKTSFALSEDECAFINAVNLQMSSLKTLLVSMVDHIEHQVNQQIDIVGELKDKFLFALADKHSLPMKGEVSLDVDVSNKLFVYRKE
jgi:hypothetical protein